MAAAPVAPTVASDLSAAPGALALPELRARFRGGKATLLSHFAEARPTAPAAAKLIRALSRHVDNTLIDLWHRAAMPDGTALLAVGGYGRGELFPHSDVDVLILLESVPDAALESKLEELVQLRGRQRGDGTLPFPRSSGTAGRESHARGDEHHCHGGPARPG